MNRSAQAIARHLNASYANALSENDVADFFSHKSALGQANKSQLMAIFSESHPQLLCSLARELGISIQTMNEKYTFIINTPGGHVFRSKEWESAIHQFIGETNGHS